MDSFPGAFPGLEDNSPGFPFTTTLLSPETISVQKSLKLKRKVFKKHLVYQLQSLWLIMSIVCYFYDCSLLLLTLRFLTKTSLSNYQVISKHLDSTVIVFSIVSQCLFSIIIHLIRELPKPDDDGFVYGHHIVQIIGQEQLSSKYWLLGLDFLLLYVQMLTYSSIFVTRRDYKTTYASTPDQEYDGAQGRTVAVRAGFLESFMPRWLTVNELVTIQEEERQNTDEQASAFARLLGVRIGEEYGTMNQPVSAT